MTIHYQEYDLDHVIETYMKSLKPAKKDEFIWNWEFYVDTNKRKVFAKMYIDEKKK